MSAAPAEPDPGPGSHYVLSGVRVLEFTSGVAGAYCTKLLADAGADVVRVERDGAGPRGSTRPPGLFEYLDTSKRSVGAAEGARLVGAADIVVAGAGFDVEAARTGSPALVVVTISAFGRTGPWAGRPGTEFTMQADCGSIGGRGLPGEAPLAAGGGLGEWLASLYSAITALALWIRASRDGTGDHADVAVLDCMAVGMVTFPSVFADFARSSGRKALSGATRRIEVPSVEPTLDGYVNFTTNSAQQFADFATLIGHPELPGDERFARPLARFEHREEFWTMVRAYTSTRTTSQVLAEAGLLRIPVAPVLDATSIPAFEQFVARQVLVDHPSGRFRQPRVPYRLHGLPPRPFEPVDPPRQHDGAVGWQPRSARPTPGAGSLPLEGLRVIDLTSWWAGPCATQVLAFLGADVIKVESTVRPDLMRYSSAKSPGDPEWWEWGPLAHAVNTNKRGVTIDLTRPEGRELALDLAASAHVMVENYTPRVLAQFGLEWEDLYRVNPRINLVRMPAFGLDGPWRDRPGFAQTMEALTGLAAATGWADGSPVLVGGAGDPVAGLHASFATLVALVATRKHGRGYLVESTMVESALSAAAGPVIANQLTGEFAGRNGNRSTIGSAPQGVYRCADGGWLALEVEDDDQWRRLGSVLGTPAAIGAGGLDDGAGRLAHHDALDRWLEQCFTRSRAEDLVGRLVGAGVPAAVVIPPARLADNPQLRHRGLFELEDHPITGLHRVPGLPASVHTVGSWLRGPSPMLGQHNDEVLAALGVGEGRRRELAELGIIGRAPVGL